MIEDAIRKRSDAPERAAEKHALEQERAKKREDVWATDAAQAVARKWLPTFAKGLEAALRDGEARQAVRELLDLIRAPVSDPESPDKLPPERLALCILHGALQSIGKNETYTDTSAAIGRNIYMECLRAKLLSNRKDLVQRIERTLIRGSLTRRRDKARSEAKKAGYRTDDWDTPQFTQAGNWAINQLLKLSNVFIRDDESGKEKHLTLHPEALADVERFVADVIQQRPVWLPEAEPPRPWTDLNEGGAWNTDEQKVLKIVRSWHKETDTAVKEAIREGRMQHPLDALNTLQGVPWKINKRVLEVIRECVARGTVVKGLPSSDRLPLPPRVEGMNADKEKAWKEKVRETRRHNRRNDNDKVGLTADLSTADMLAEYPRFYTPMNLDWRGRVYPLPYFNFQRDDRVRALFLFANGASLGEGGLHWLKIHLANRGDFNKISKEPFEARIAWVDANEALIKQTAASPFENVDWWSKASAPFQFLAACFELADARAEGPHYEAHLPVRFDGACNGLQHLCAMIRVPEGSEVNLTPNERPQDIYQTVADKTLDRIKKR